jgi:hypothetical protein
VTSEVVVSGSPNGLLAAIVVGRPDKQKQTQSKCQKENQNNFFDFFT